MSAVTIVQEGIVPCRKCERPHNAYRTKGSKQWGSWKSLEDGHPYESMSAEEVVRFYDVRIAGVRAVADHGDDLEQLAEL